MHRTVILGFWVWPLMHLPLSPSFWGCVASAMPLLEHGRASGTGADWKDRLRLVQ